MIVAILASVSTMISGAGADTLADKQAEARQIADKMAVLPVPAHWTSTPSTSRAEYELHLAEQKVADAEALAERAAAEVERRQADLQQFAINAYQSGNDSGAFDALFTSDPGSGAEKVSYLENLSGNKRDLIDAFNGAKA